MLGLSCWAWTFYSCREWGPLSSCGAWAALCPGFSYYGVQILGTRASVVPALSLQSSDSVVVAYGLSCSKACGIFQTRNVIWVACISKQIPIHCTTREVLISGAGITRYPYGKNKPWPLPHIIHKNCFEMNQKPKHNIFNYKASRRKQRRIHSWPAEM